MEGKDRYGFEMIRKEDIEQIIKKGHVLIIDLRSEERYRQGHLKYARNFPFVYIDKWKNDIPEYIPIILYCEHGNQSLIAARKLKGRKGTLYTLIGGYSG